MTYQEIIDTVKIETKRDNLEDSLILANVESSKAAVVFYQYIDKMKVPPDDFYQSFDKIPVEIVSKTKLGSEGLATLPLKVLDG